MYEIIECEGRMEVISESMKSDFRRFGKNMLIFQNKTESVHLFKAL